MPRYQYKGAMLLKCKSTPVKVGLKYTLILNFSLQIVSSTLRSGGKGPETTLTCKTKVEVLVVKHI